MKMNEIWEFYYLTSFNERALEDNQKQNINRNSLDSQADFLEVSLLLVENVLTLKCLHKPRKWMLFLMYSGL